MELLTLSTSLSLGFLLCVLCLYFRRQHGSAAGLPPGRMGLPVVGEYPSFMFNGRKGRPEKFILDRMASHSARAFKTWMIGGPTVVMCGADGNRFLFSNDNKIVRVWFPASIHKILPSSSSSDALHAKKLLLHLLLPDNLQRYTSIVDKLARSHFTTSWEGKKQVRVQPLARNYTFAVACKLFFNIEDHNQIGRFEEAFDHVVSGIVSLPVNLPGMAFHRAIKAAESIKKELLHMVRLRKKEMADAKSKNGDGGDHLDDLLSLLLLSNVDKTNSEEFMMSDEQIVDRMLAVLVASRDSASSTISFLIKYLADLPQIYHAQMEIARRKGEEELLNWDDIRQMKYSWNVVSEVLRLASPYQAAFREVVEGFHYAGYHIPKGWKVFIYRWYFYTTLEQKCKP
ncbi:hypothetical protein V2J09_011422 [Rumex salicifolius]